MVTQGAPTRPRFMFKAFMYQTGEKDPELHYVEICFPTE
jgi:hypothetical protein